MVLAASAAPAEGQVDFNRDVRRILSENCFKCHGPDANERKGTGKGLRLDTLEGATALSDGKAAVIPSHPETSELIRRVTTDDLDDLMPPPKSGPRLPPEDVATLKRWIAQGAPYARHWAYEKPRRPAVPTVKDPSWVLNPIDAFIHSRLEREGLKPGGEADAAALIRRASLDLTGLPPSIEEVDRFLGDKEPGAYGRLVGRLLESPSYGEHWARLWLDQARYADSSGYADDPGRTIWAYRDYVIRAINSNKPFDQFTLEQIAGDLLPDPSDDQLTATAFHRNTMTNNEGGTSDEEFRNVAVVDRVNTTLAVWMGTTMACAQCHDHKYDPISQEDYFNVFAILNNTADADRPDESPVASLFTQEQKNRRKALQEEIAQLQKVVRTSTPELARAQAAWESQFLKEPAWQVLKDLSAKSEAGAMISTNADGTVSFDRGGKTDTYTLSSRSATNGQLTALRIEALPDERPPGRGAGHAGGNFVLSGVRAEFVGPEQGNVSGRFLRVELPGKDRFLSLAEVQVFSGGTNIATQGEARQSSTDFEGAASRAIDGNTDGDYAKSKSTTHTALSADPWWELDLKSPQTVDRLRIWNRTDGAGERLKDFVVVLLDSERKPVWRRTVAAVPSPSAEFRPSLTRQIPLAEAYASHGQKEFNVASLTGGGDAASRGWAIAPRFGEPHSLTLIPTGPIALSQGSNLVVSLEQLSRHEHATMARVRLSVSTDPVAAEFVRTPASVLAVLRSPVESRTDAGKQEVERHYLSVAPGLAGERDRLASLTREMEGIRPYTSVPVMKELAGDQRRKTHVQRRGNFMDLGKEVTGGLPATFHPAPAGSPPASRLTLARWLVDTNNPLTARVVVNRYWETLFGIGIVRTSEEFGAQGEPPSHPELLDWLAVEFMDSGWDVKHLLKLMVTSATYRQSSKVSPELTARDPDNRLLARGPRFRLPAETIRDQALAVGGLLSRKLNGPPVKPPQPKLGLSAAFGSGTDWETSMGEDRYRRALYTTWRRSNPYPSMATFDAPSREVCTVRRDRSNTPLQALVTLNDPVYVEASQALARRMAVAGRTPGEKARHGFRLCLAREPAGDELSALLKLYAKTYERFVGDRARSKSMATEPLGPASGDAEVAELAAWTVVGNVLLNLDETLMKR